jgi:hypothetical protein
LPKKYGGPNPSRRPLPMPELPRRFREPPPDATPEQLAEFERRRERILARIREQMNEVVPANEARIGRFEVAGPHEQTAGPGEASLRKVFTCGHRNGEHRPECAKKIVGDFARRAFRRPVPALEIEPYLRLVTLAQNDGDSFEEGICLALQGVLVSPHFLFRIEKDPAPRTGLAARPVSEHELASRLSYFLWSSTPDDELLRVADQRRLRRPAVLRAQVRRMLLDPRSAALVENFGGQWLEFRKLESLRPDPERFPAFEEYLRLSMRRETELFFQHLILEDRSILDFLDGNYTYLNERLAAFYGIEGVRGPEFRRVDLSGTARGGVLTQASVLTVSSYATRTSPVLRGRWILENILNAPPPPPPPDVPVLDEAKLGESVSLRDQLEAHRSNPVCASCHTRMDALGFALENFDAIGAWRTTEGKLPIDASASLPDGRTFSGPEELKAILKADREEFAECMTEKLLTYALGRGLERYDRRTVRTIAANLEKHDYRFSGLVLEIVDSLPFQMRRGDQAE